MINIYIILFILNFILDLNLDKNKINVVYLKLVKFFCECYEKRDKKMNM